MTIRENLWVFNVGDKVTAEETNDNNETLQSWINDHSSTEAYIDAKMAELSTSLDASISSINTQISTLNSGLASKLSAAYTNTSGLGCIKLSNKWCIQWGAVEYTGTGTVSLNFKQNFANTSYVPVGAWDATQVAGDKRMTWRINQKNTGSVQLGIQLEGTNSQKVKIFIVAMGEWK